MRPGGRLSLWVVTVAVAFLLTACITSTSAEATEMERVMIGCAQRHRQLAFSDLSGVAWDAAIRNCTNDHARTHNKKWLCARPPSASCTASGSYDPQEFDLGNIINVHEAQEKVTAAE